MRGKASLSSPPDFSDLPGQEVFLKSVPVPAARWRECVVVCDAAETRSEKTYLTHVRVN